MPPTLSPQDALNNLAQVADATPLDGPNRRTIDTSVHVLQEMINAAIPKKPELPPKAATANAPKPPANASAKTDAKLEDASPSE